MTSKPIQSSPSCWYSWRYQSSASLHYLSRLFHCSFFTLSFVIMYNPSNVDISDLLPEDYMNEQELQELMKERDAQDMEQSIPNAAERNRNLQWTARFFPAKISPKCANGAPILHLSPYNVPLNWHRPLRLLRRFLPLLLRISRGPKFNILPKNVPTT